MNKTKENGMKEKWRRRGRKKEERREGEWERETVSCH